MATPKELRSAVLDVDVEKVQSILLNQPELVRTVYTSTHTLLHDVTDYARVVCVRWLSLGWTAEARDCIHRRSRPRKPVYTPRG